jgi:hypothetical protein
MQDSFARSLHPLPLLASASQSAAASPAAAAAVETVPSVHAANISSSNTGSAAAADGGGSITQLGNVVLAQAAGVYSPLAFFLYFAFLWKLFFTKQI